MYQFRHRPAPVMMSNPMFQQATLIVGQQRVRVRVPQTEAASEQGLSGVTSLTDEEGMYWEFQELGRPNFWMKDMLIPLDFLWIRDGVVQQITPNVPAPKNGNLPIYQPTADVTNVLEVPAGFAERHGIKVGTGVTNE